MPQNRNWRYDYYHIEVWYGEGLSNEDVINTAIEEARERAKLCCMPCVWTAEIIVGSMENSGKVIVKVRRKRVKA